MAQVEARKLEIDSIIPHFILPALEGGRVDTRDYKQKTNLVIAYLDLERCEGGEDFVRELADNYRSYGELEAEVLVVCPQPLPELQRRLGHMGLPFPVLSDESGEVGRTYLGDQWRSGAGCGIFLTDRFGALQVALPAQGEKGLPNQATILDWITLIESECPECGPSDVGWPR